MTTNVSNTTTIDYGTIIGFTLFAISEIIPLLPIPANGIFHSFLIGLHNSFKNPIKDIESGKKIMDKINGGGNNNDNNAQITDAFIPDLEANSKSISIPPSHFCCNCQSDLNEVMEYIKQNPNKLKNIKDFIGSQGE